MPELLTLEVHYNGYIYAGNGFASVEHEDGGWDWNRGYGRGRGRGRGRKFRGHGRGEGYNGAQFDTHQDAEVYNQEAPFQGRAYLLLCSYLIGSFMHSVEGTITTLTLAQLVCLVP